MSNNSNRYFSRKELAKKLNYSERRLYDFIKEGIANNSLDIDPRAKISEKEVKKIINYLKVRTKQQKK